METGDADVEAAPVEEAVLDTAPVDNSSPEATAAEAKAADGNDAKPTEADAAGAKKDAGDGKEAKKDSRPRPVANAATLYRAFRSKRAIEGRVEGVIKGGFEIKIGPARGFCPQSQIDVDRVTAPESYVGKSLHFQIVQVRRGGADVVVSRRLVMEEERSEEAKAVRATLIEGSVMLGKVTGMAAFGVFVDLGAGVSGLVHVSEVSHTRIKQASDVLKVGDPVTVKVLKLDDKRGRISLSIRGAQEDPWASASKNYEVGQTYKGTVRRQTDFGVFVELAAGVEALAPASELPPAKGGWRDVLTVGSEHEWLVLSVDPKRHRISLTVPVEGASMEDAAGIEAGAKVKARVQRIERFGVFLWLGPGRVGLMPNELSGSPRGADLSRRYPVGEEIEVEVVEVGEDGHRIRLAAPGAKEARAADRAAAPGRGPRKPRAEGGRGPRRKAPAGPTASDDPAGFGQSLAEKLRAALGDSSTPQP